MKLITEMNTLNEKSSMFIRHCLFLLILVFATSCGNPRSLLKEGEEAGGYKVEVKKSAKEDSLTCVDHWGVAYAEEGGKAETCRCPDGFDVVNGPQKIHSFWLHIFSYEETFYCKKTSW